MSAAYRDKAKASVQRHWPVAESLDSLTFTQAHGLATDMNTVASTKNPRESVSTYRELRQRSTESSDNHAAIKSLITRLSQLIDPVNDLDLKE
jgi:hypothetical protein